MKNLSIVRRFIAGATFVAGFAHFASPVFAATTSEVAPTATQVGAYITKINPNLPDALRQSYASQALAAAHEAAIDPCLLIAVVSVESHWKAAAISPHGAIGLGQLKPGTAASLHANPYSPGENLRATSMYLRQLLDRFAGLVNTRSVAIAAYNAGPNAVERAHNQAPNASTASYVSRVMHLWQETRSALGRTKVAAAPHAKPRSVASVTAPAPSAYAPKSVNAQENNYWGLDIERHNRQVRQVGYMRMLSYYFSP